MSRTRGGKNICGVSIGVLSLESYFPKPPGHIKNPASLPFTTCYEILNGISVPELLYLPTQEMEDTIVKAARNLECQGVNAISSSCGFLARYQQIIVNAVSIPVFISSLIQIPLAYQMTGRPVGVITADSNSLTDNHLNAVGAATTPVVIAGLQDTQEFASVILRDERRDMDLQLVQKEVHAKVTSLLQNSPEIGALVLECTDLPPYAHHLQQQLKIPIFDLTTLATMVDSVVQRQAYTGFI